MQHYMSQLPTTNTGLDEILEVGKRLSTSGSNYLNSRSAY